MGITDLNQREYLLQKMQNPGKTKVDILFGGDMYETDVKGASGAGIEVAWINRKNESDEKQLATYSISGMEQLQEIIDLRILRSQDNETFFTFG